MSSNPKLLRGVVPPVCTPFTADYEVDEKSLRRLINHLIDGGVHGLFVLGSTSEVAYLTDKRRADVIRIALDETAGRVPVVAGAIDMTTFRVNDHVRANIGLHMLYDDDVKAKEQINGVQTTVGPKVQLKQGLGIGFVYIFKEKKSSTP